MPRRRPRPGGQASETLPDQPSANRRSPLAPCAGVDEARARDGEGGACNLLSWAESTPELRQHFETEPSGLMRLHQERMGYARIEPGRDAWAGKAHRLVGR